MSLLWFKCLTIRLLKMFYQHHRFCHFKYFALMFATIYRYSFRKPVPAKLSYFSSNLNYGLKQIAKPKWKSCQRDEKLASDKIYDSGECIPVTLLAKVHLISTLDLQYFEKAKITQYNIEYRLQYSLFFTFLNYHRNRLFLYFLVNYRISIISLLF